MKTAAIAILLLLTALHADAPRTPVLVELFTSEGCSSCPPADAFLTTLLKDQPIANAEVVPLELHVDYWDRLGWKDPFSAAAYTARQQDYSRIFGPDKVYTPQMVIDGRTEAIGSIRGDVTKAIVAAVGQPHLSLRATARQSGNALRLTIDVPAAGNATEPIEIAAALTEDDLTSVVSRGENRGHTLTHTGVVRKIQSLGTLQPDAFVAEGQYQLERSWNAAKLRAVVWLQGRKTRHVYGTTAASVSQ